MGCNSSSALFSRLADPNSAIVLKQISNKVNLFLMSTCTTNAYRPVPFLYMQIT